MWRCFTIINTIQVILYNIRTIEMIIQQSGVEKSIAFVFSKYLNLQIHPHTPSAIENLNQGKKRQLKKALTYCLSHTVCKWTVTEPWSRLCLSVRVCQIYCAHMPSYTAWLHDEFLFNLSLVKTPHPLFYLVTSTEWTWILSQSSNIYIFIPLNSKIVILSSTNHLSRHFGESNSCVHITR